MCCGHELPRVERMLNRFEAAAEELRLRLCQAIYVDLEEVYDYLTDEEQLLDMADANDYTFNTDGERED